MSHRATMRKAAALKGRIPYRAGKLSIRWPLSCAASGQSWLGARSRAISLRENDANGKPATACGESTAARPMKDKPDGHDRAIMTYRGVVVRDGFLILKAPIIVK